MKIHFLRGLVIWRRFRRGSRHHGEHHLQFSLQAEALMKRANPFSPWHERANWVIDLVEWIRREPTVSRMENDAWRRVKHQRIRIVLDWLDVNRDTKRVVQTTLQKTLREAAGTELFFTLGLPRESAFFSEMAERLVKFVLPNPPAQQDISALFMTMFPEPGDADWLDGLDQKTLSRIWKLCADDGIAHAYQQQIDEALLYLVTVVLSVGISPAFRQRLDPSNSLKATPFMTLRRELEKYLQTGSVDESALRSVRMLIAVCQAQTDRIYSHLDENGVSVGLVYSIERMRAQLARMSRLIDLRSAAAQPQGANQVQALLVDMVQGQRRRFSLRGMVRRSFSLLARKMAERNAAHGGYYVARNPTGYWTVFKAAAIGGVVSVFAVFAQLWLSHAPLAHFFEGVFASLALVLSLILISLMRGTFAAKQPAVTTPALASRMGELDTDDGMRGLMLESAALLRAQAASVFGAVVTLLPTMAVVSIAILWATGAPVMSPDKAQASLRGLSMLGVTPLFAAVTGVLLWAAGMAACLADNWFALRRLRESLAHNRRLVRALGVARAERWAAWLDRHIVGIVGNVALAVLLGMTPVFAQFFGLPFEIRHVALAAGTLVADACSLGLPVLESREFWLAVGGVVLVTLLNVGVAFICALTLALRTSGVPGRVRRQVFRLMLSQLARKPHIFLFAGGDQAVGDSRHGGAPVKSIEQADRKKNG